MSTYASRITKELALSEEELSMKSLRAFLLEQLRLFEAERKARCAKFGATDLWEMETLIKQGAVTEEVIQDGFQDVDYLTARVRRIKAMLEVVLSPYGRAYPPDCRAMCAHCGGT